MAWTLDLPKKAYPAGIPVIRRERDLVR